MIGEVRLVFLELLVVSPAAVAFTAANTETRAKLMIGAQLSLDAWLYMQVVDAGPLPKRHP